MKIGVIGNGIIGTAVAATLRKHLNNNNMNNFFSSSPTITVIDDQRPHKTSEAGQGYLWSIHRHDDTVGFDTSMLAKKAWIDLIDDKDSSANGTLLKREGSLLIAPKNDLSLKRYYDRAKYHLPGLQLVEDASVKNQFLKPSMYYGLYYPDDYTCTPPDLIKYLKRKYNLIGCVEEFRTVVSLKEELLKYDYLICCAGPWITELEKNINVVPVRGLLLEAQVGDMKYIDGNNLGSTLVEESVPVMEYGYGGEGVHFTLSFRDDQLLIGASRESVGFSDEGLDNVEENIIQHAHKFTIAKAIGTVTDRRLGFRPSCSDENSSDRKYYLKQICDGKVILLYGFEGQGVLYASLAALDVVSLLFNAPNQV